MKQLLILAISLSTLAVLALAAFPLTTANAITEGTIVTFMMRSDDIQPAPPSGPQDGLRFTGKPATFVELPDSCAEGDHPVQRAALIDMDARSGLVDVIVLSETDPIPAGTELTNLTPAIRTCALDGVVYDWFTGIAHTPNPSDD